LELESPDARLAVAATAVRLAWPDPAPAWGALAGRLDAMAPEYRTAAVAVLLARDPREVAEAVQSWACGPESPATAETVQAFASALAGRWPERFADALRPCAGDRGAARDAALEARIGRLRPDSGIIASPSPWAARLATGDPASALDALPDLDPAAAALIRRAVGARIATEPVVTVLLDGARTFRPGVREAAEAMLRWGTSAADLGDLRDALDAARPGSPTEALRAAWDRLSAEALSVE
jgi:hypothetical protein